VSASPATRESLDALRRHLDGSKWALLEEVDRIDLLAIGCWRSTGYRWHGYEIKVSRSDWRRELAKPGKAQDGLCHAWTVVTTPGVAKVEELLPGWGLAEVRDGRVVYLRRPTTKPSPLSQCGTDYDAIRHLMARAAVARRASYAEADARALVQAWPGTQEQLAAALAAAQKETARFIPGIGVYGSPRESVA
jgi:hypothetical protein